MNTEAILHDFYSAFAEENADRMVTYYTDETVFSDPAFGTLKGPRAMAMWQMLMERSKGQLQIEYEIAEANTGTGVVRWQADYPFGPDKRRVINHVTSRLILENGKIIRHADSFSFGKWSRQALGLPGLLLGWTPFMQKAVQKKTGKLLSRYMEKHNPE
ncbi:MAG: nuclear transport factor 2 family protein [Cyclobacteriaceae bacterium]